MRIRIVVLNWNGRRWLEACLTALAADAGPDVETMLVDNASTDDSVAFVRDRFPWVRVLPLSANLGFAEGNNRGAAGATAEYLVFLNNDTVVQPGWLAALAAEADASPDVGLVTSCVVCMDEVGRIDSAGDGYLRAGGAFKIGHGAPAARLRESRDVFGACGAAFLIRRALFERLGGFASHFFMVYEDVDLSYRARLAGARVRYAADAVVRHAVSGSIGRMSPQAVYYGQRNLEWTWLRNSPRPVLVRSVAAHLVYGLAAGLAYARQGLFGPWLRGKLAALRRLRATLAERRVIQATAVASADDLWRVMDADWVAVKRREKQFAFGPVSAGR